MSFVHIVSRFEIYSFEIYNVFWLTYATLTRILTVGAVCRRSSFSIELKFNLLSKRYFKTSCLFVPINKWHAKMLSNSEIKKKIVNLIFFYLRSFAFLIKQENNLRDLSNKISYDIFINLSIFIKH